MEGEVCAGDETRGQEAHSEMERDESEQKEKRDTKTLIQSPEHGYEGRIVFRLNLQAQNMKVTPLQVVEAEFRVSLCRL